MPTPYGEWPSPLSPADVAESGRSFGGVAIDDGTVFWLERRPVADGRGVVVREGPDGPVDVTPEGYDVRTLVHQYGGGDFLVADGSVWFTNLDDQRVYRHPVGPHERAGAADAAGSAGRPDPDGIVPVTPAGSGEKTLRYADFVLTPDGETLYAVRERHDEGDEPSNELVRIPAAGGEPSVIAEGHDFYAAPRLSPDGDRLAFLAWDHPQMPWDGTKLYAATLDADGEPREAVHVAGGPEESLICPTWGPDGRLHVVSDRTGWWNLYRFPDASAAELAGTDPTALYPTAAEFGGPAWRLGLSTYAFLDDGRIAILVTDEGVTRLRLLDPETGTLAGTDLPYTTFRPTRLRSDGSRLAFVAGEPTEPTAVVSWEPPAVDADTETDGEPDPIRHREALDIDLPDDYVSEPEPVMFPTGDAIGADETVAHAIYYPPTNPAVDPPADERPPAVVTVHGGPTGRSEASLSLSTQFWTTRGVGVLDVNYRGSTGYGREYRESLTGEWGVRDVLDCVNAARYASDRTGEFGESERFGPVDPDRLAISGGSAGGYTVLCALAFYDAFDAGTSYYGVADLEALSKATHKFESRYLDSLVGPLPEARETYRERSPVFHAAGIDSPLLLLQGGKDEVVPPAQASAMIDALVENGTPYAYVEFPAERHGFRNADSIARAHEAELTFYADVFGFAPDGDLDPVDVIVGERP